AVATLIWVMSAECLRPADRGVHLSGAPTAPSSAAAAAGDARPRLSPLQLSGQEARECRRTTWYAFSFDRSAGPQSCLHSRINRQRVRFTLVIIATLIALGLARPASAVDTKLPQTPATISTDRISYDEDLGIIVASGHVEISQQDRVLLADTVTYNQRTDTVTASGNVSLHEPTGEIIYADYFELTEGLKDGVAQNFRLMMQNKARFASTGARREGGVVTEMANGVYSLCELCKDDPDRAPLWQLKGARIIHNEDEHEVYFEDATLEMFGVPIAYSPYFSAPDPTVKRRSGFLTPTGGNAHQ